MKKIFLSFIFLLSATVSHAQFYPYTYNNFQPNFYRNYQVNINISLWSNPINYFNSFQNFYSGSWFFRPAPRNLQQGFGLYIAPNGYPYWLHNGFMHRYSNVDLCNYQLIEESRRQIINYDRWGRAHRRVVPIRQVVRNIPTSTCLAGFQACHQLLYSYPWKRWNSRYFCAETYRRPW